MMVHRGLNAKKPYSCKKCKESFRAKWKFRLNHSEARETEEGAMRNETICEEGELTDNGEEGELLIIQQTNSTDK